MQKFTKDCDQWKCISGQNIFYFKVEKVNKYKMEYYKQFQFSKHC